MLKTLPLLIFMVIFSSTANALSPMAEEGKKQFAICSSCHNPDLEPPKGPPMFGVQRRYTRAYGSKEEVIKHIIAFVKQPSLDKVLMRNAAENMGLMPPLPLPEETLNSIAHYIYEESFAPPCKHWEIAIKRLSNQPGQENHLLKDQRMYDRFCR